MNLKRISRLLNNEDPIIILPYDGYGNETHVHSQARVLEDENIQHDEDDGVIKNLWNSYKRFETDEKEDAKLTAKWDNNILDLISDDEGYVYVNE